MCALNSGIVCDFTLVLRPWQCGTSLFNDNNKCSQDGEVVPEDETLQPTRTADQHSRVTNSTYTHCAVFPCGNHCQVGGLLRILEWSCVKAWVLCRAFTRTKSQRPWKSLQFYFHLCGVEDQAWGILYTKQVHLAPGVLVWKPAHHSRLKNA